METTIKIFESIKALPLNEQILTECRLNEIEERKDFETLALHSLSRAYDADEAEYSLEDTIEYKQGHTI